MLRARRRLSRQPSRTRVAPEALERRTLLAATAAENLPPVADPGGPYSVAEGASVVIAGSASDSDGTVVKKEWDLDYDGTTFNVDVIQQISSGFQYDTRWLEVGGPATRTLAFRVTDNAAATTIATTTLQVTNVPPTVQPVSGRTWTDEGALYRINLAASDVRADTLTWTVDWGDGRSDTYVSNGADYRLVEATHRYADGPSAYTIRASVSDGSDTTAAAPFNVAVQNVAPTLELRGSGRAGAGVPYALDLVASDPGDDRITGWTIDWGDGTVEAASTGRVTHTYGAAGQYTISARATDDDGTYQGGFLDPAFGEDGIVATDFLPGNSSQGQVVVPLADGRLLAVGYVNVPDADGFRPAVALARYLPDGAPDAAFGQGGRSIAAFGPGGEIVQDAVELPGGKIAVAGYLSPLNPFEPYHPFVARFNADGSPDATFGAGGYVSPTVPDAAYAMFSRVLPLPDGGVLASGWTNGPPVNGEMKYLLARFTPAGALDPAFGDGGLVVTNASRGTADANPDIALLPGGKILLGGYVFHPTEARTLWAALRYNADGALDTSYGGGDGIATTDLGDNLSVAQWEMATQPDGKFLLGGVAYDPFKGSADYRMAITRFNPDGSVDASFADGGTFFGPVGVDQLGNMAVASDGRIFVGGTRFDDPFTRLQGLPFLFALDSAGRPDPTFTPGAERLIGRGPGMGGGFALTNDGGLVVAGNVPDGERVVFALSRYVVRLQAGVLASPAPVLGPDGTFAVTGTGDEDDVVVTRAGDAYAVTVNGATYDVPAAQVNRIAVSALGGDDAVTVLAGGGPAGGVVVEGGEGNDSFVWRAGDGAPAPVTFDGGAGDDVTTVPPAPAGSLTLRGDAGDDRLVLPGTASDDVFGVSGNSARNGGVNIAIESPGVRSIEVAGGAGDDRFELSALDRTPDLYALLDGGDGSDRLQFLGGDDSDVFNILPDPGAGDIAVTLNRAVAQTLGTEFIDIDAAGGSDQFSIRNLSRTTSVSLRGGDGNDRFEFARNLALPVANPTNAPFLADGGPGLDQFVFDDEFSRQYVYDLGSGVLARSGDNSTPIRIDYAGVDDVRLFTGGARDLIRVTPSPEAAIDVSARAPSTAPGDRLYVDTAGTTDPQLARFGDDAGRFTFADRQPVSFTGVEHLNDPAPLVVSALYRQVDNGSSLNFVFSEDVSQSLAGTWVQIQRDRSPGGEYRVGFSDFIPETLTARYGLGRQPSGHHVATLAAADVVDAAGNTMARDFVFEFDVPATRLAGDGTLFVNGTEGDDKIDLSLSADGRLLIVTLNEALYPYQAAQVRKIDVWGARGVDATNVAPAVNIPIRHDGGDGNDRITFDGTGGDDTFAVDNTQTGINAAPRLVINGRTASAADFLNTETLVLNGDAGNDVLNGLGSVLASAPVTPKVLFDGGDGADRLTLRADTTSGEASFQVRPDGVAIGRRLLLLSPTNVESTAVYGGAGMDSFSVLGTPAGTTVSVYGLGNNDGLSLIGFSGGVGDLSQIKGDLFFDGGEGAGDSVSAGDFDANPAPAARSYTVTDASVSRDGANYGRLTYGGVETVFFTASARTDTVRVTPSPTASFTLEGSAPTSGTPADRLEVNLAGATQPRRPFPTQYTFANRKPITFTGFESTSDIIAPTIAAPGIGYNPATQTLTVRFSENVSPSLGVDDLLVTNRSTGRAVAPTAVTYNATSNTASYTFGGGLPAGRYEVKVLAAGVEDAARNRMEADAAVNFDVQGVVRAGLFYNNSAFDGYTGGAPVAGDSQAVDPTKAPWRPGSPVTAANISGYTKGINGVWIDLLGYPATLDPADFEFRVGDKGDPANWTVVQPLQVGLVDPAGGASGVPRLLFTFADGDILNAWLRVRVIGNGNTGFYSSDVFYFGSLAGDGADLLSPGQVQAVEAFRARSAMSSRRAEVDNRFDFNKDGRVNATDNAVARRALGTILATPQSAPSPGVARTNDLDDLLA